MYDKELLQDMLYSVIEAVEKVQKRCACVKSSDDFLKDENSQILLDSVCMQLIAIGQGVKDIDKLTNKSLFVKYPQIPWKSIAGIRDILSHNYFDLNAQTVFGVCSENIKELKDTLVEINKKNFKESYRS